MDPARPEEIEAIGSFWRDAHPEAPPEALPTEEEEQALLVRIREREELIEQEALKMLNRATRVPPSRSGAGCWIRMTLTVLVFVAVLFLR